MNDKGELFKEGELDSENIDNDFWCYYGWDILEPVQRTVGQQDQQV